MSAIRWGVSGEGRGVSGEERGFSGEGRDISGEGVNLPVGPMRDQIGIGTDDPR